MPEIYLLPILINAVKTLLRSLFIIHNTHRFALIRMQKLFRRLKRMQLWIYKPLELFKHRFLSFLYRHVVKQTYFNPRLVTWQKDNAVSSYRFSNSIYNLRVFIPRCQFDPDVVTLQPSRFWNELQTSNEAFTKPTLILVNAWVTPFLFPQQLN